MVFTFLFSLLVPAGVGLPASNAFAANPSSFLAARSLLSASSSPGNAYFIGASVVTTAPVEGDLSAIGGSVITAAPVAGDELLIAGSIRSRAQVSGDFRAIGGSISVEKPIKGDLVALGFSVYDSSRTSGSVFITALNTTLTNGAVGPVTIYGNNVSLAGDFAGDVTVVAGGHLGVMASTTIHGKLSYEAPEKINLPASVTILGGIEYKNISYLPNAGTSRILSFVSVGFFLLVRILGALILAGLLAGLFPKLTQAVVEHAYKKRLRSIFLTILLGFAILVATPILLVVLMLTFVGIGIALLLFIAYALVVFLALIYAGILLGGLFVRRYIHRETTLWHDGVLGMLVLSIISLIPTIGLIVVFLLMFFAAGALLQIFFDFTFSGENTSELL
ncbi:MAG: hypothetical protein WC638_00620 [Candidatus Paceibacterota bacterium]